MPSNTSLKCGIREVNDSFTRAGISKIMLKNKEYEYPSHMDQEIITANQKIRNSKRK